jgi:hypothetical protein
VANDGVDGTESLCAEYLWGVKKESNVNKQMITDKPSIFFFRLVYFKSNKIDSLHRGPR